MPNGFKDFPVDFSFHKALSSNKSASAPVKNVTLDAFDKLNWSLTNKKIDIWSFSLNNTSFNAEDYLGDDELQRAERFYFPIHKQRFIAAHTIQRLVLSRYLGCTPKQITYTYNAHGKPDIPGTHLTFNLSHSQNTALLAVGFTYPLGIDLEFFSSRPYTGIGQHIYSEQENHELLELQNALKPLGFFHLWAQKEAMIKACGLGLSYPTKQLTLPLLPPVNQTTYDNLHDCHWHIRSFMPTIACCAAICHSPEVNEIQYYKFKSDEI